MARLQLLSNYYLRTDRKEASKEILISTHKAYTNLLKNENCQENEEWLWRIKVSLTIIYYEYYARLQNYKLAAKYGVIELKYFLKYDQSTTLDWIDQAFVKVVMCLGANAFAQAQHLIGVCESMLQTYKANTKEPQKLKNAKEFEGRMKFLRAMAIIYHMKASEKAHSAEAKLAAGLQLTCEDQKSLIINKELNKIDGFDVEVDERFFAFIDNDPRALRAASDQMEKFTKEAKKLLGQQGYELLWKRLITEG